MQEFRVWTDIEVRFRDTDAMNHVNNAVYVTYLEVGRQAYWQLIRPSGDYQKVPFILARVEIDFRSPARVGQILRVFVRTAWIGNHSFGTEYQIKDRDSGALIAEAKTVQATYDYEKEQVISVPDSLRRELEKLEGGSLPART